jgi:Zn finger protein HypA/HybF involved in hydrogenase expression
MTLDQWLLSQHPLLSYKAIDLEEVKQLLDKRDNIQDSQWGESIVFRLLSACPKCGRKLTNEDMNIKVCSGCGYDLRIVISSAQQNLETIDPEKDKKEDAIVVAGFSSTVAQTPTPYVQNAMLASSANGAVNQSPTSGPSLHEVDPSGNCPKCGRPYPDALIAQRICPYCKASLAKEKALEAKNKAWSVIKKYV